MKIPETSANVGAYYGNEETGQWQPNGVILDGGVGGGVVGSGDAGIHRPPVYPVHIPRGPMPAGFVMAGAYYPPAPYPPVPAQPQDDFADYMWMENEEEFDKQVMQQLEEEALMEQCIEAMLEDEQRERQNRPVTNGHKHYPTTSNSGPAISLEEAVSRSTLNPLAAEFVPSQSRLPTHSKQTTVTEEKTEQLPVQVQESRDSPESCTVSSPDPEPIVEKTEVSPEPQIEEPEKTQPELTPNTVEVPQEKAEKRPKEIKKEIKPKSEAKKPIKVDTKPKIVKAEVKVPVKKKEVKSVKSDCESGISDGDRTEEVVDTSKPQNQPTEELPSSGFKPINYAAAAKANKPKKPSVTATPAAAVATSGTTAEKTPPTNQKPKTAEKKDKKLDKVSSKIDKPIVQRKNSTK